MKQNTEVHAYFIIYKNDRGVKKAFRMTGTAHDVAEAFNNSVGDVDVLDIKKSTPIY